MPDLRSDTRHFLRGTQSYLFMRRESVYGEVYNSNLTSGWHSNIPATLVPGSVISKSQTFIQPDTLTGSPSMIEGELGRQTVSGTYAFFLTHPYSKAGAYSSTFTNTLLAHAFSTDILATNVTASLNQDLHTAGLGFLQLITGLSATSTSILSADYKYAAYFSGVRIGSASITAPNQDSAVDIAVQFVGKEGEFFDRSDNITLPSTLSSWNLNSGNRAEPNFFPSWSTDVTLTKDETSYNMVFSSVRLSIDNNLQPIDFLNGSKTVSGFQRGQRSITGSLTIPLYYNSSDSNTTQFLKDFFNKQNYSMKIRFNAEESNKHIEFSMPNVVFSADLTPDNINQGTVEMDIQFTAYPKKEETVVYAPTKIQVDTLNTVVSNRRIYWKTGNSIIKSNNLTGNSTGGALVTTTVHTASLDINPSSSFEFSTGSGTSASDLFTAVDQAVTVYKSFNLFQPNSQYTIKFNVITGNSSSFYFHMLDDLDGYTGSFASISKGSIIGENNIRLSDSGVYEIVVEDVEDVERIQFMNVVNNSVTVSDFEIIDASGDVKLIDFAFDPTNTSSTFDIYYSLSAGYIRKVDSEGSNDTNFFDYSELGSSTFFTKILVDNTYVYFLTTDYKINRVEILDFSNWYYVAPTGGLTTDQPNLLALDSTNDNIFFNKPSENKIYMADISSIPFSSSTLIVDEALDTIKDMVFTNSRLYWLEGNSFKYKVYNSGNNTFGDTVVVTNTSLISGNIQDISVVPLYIPTQDVIYFVEDTYGLSSITTNDDPPSYSKLITPVGITFNENTELTISVN